MMGDERLTLDGRAFWIGRFIPLDIGDDGRWMQGCWVIRFNGEGAQLMGPSLDRAAFTALMGMMGA